MGKILFEAGEANPMAKLTREEVEEIRTIVASGEMSQRQVARVYGISQPVVSDIVHGKLWK